MHTGQNGIFVNEKFQNVAALLYADDVVLISNALCHLRNLIATVVVDDGSLST